MDQYPHKNFKGYFDEIPSKFRVLKLPNRSLLGKYAFKVLTLNNYFLLILLKIVEILLKKKSSCININTKK